ncbi:MAG TPA: PRC-barrel domain-containing protein [Stellaceae bacterium]|nr:PRC-barrel domain-containing protein [Stellaceae bacterium]
MIRFRLLAPLAMLAALSLATGSASADDAAPKEQPKPAAPAAPVKPAPVVTPHKGTPKEVADSLLGKEVFGADGAQMGLVTNVLLDRDGRPIALVIDFGGFLGVGTRKIAIDWHLMEFHPGDKKKPVTLKIDKDQLKSAPEYKPDKAARIVGAPTTPAPAPEPPKQTGNPTADDKPAAPPANTGTK